MIPRTNETKIKPEWGQSVWDHTISSHIMFNMWVKKQRGYDVCVASMVKKVFFNA